MLILQKIPLVVCLAVAPALASFQGCLGGEMAGTYCGWDQNTWNGIEALYSTDYGHFCEQMTAGSGSFTFTWGAGQTVQAQFVIQPFMSTQYCTTAVHDIISNCLDSSAHYVAAQSGGPTDGGDGYWAYNGGTWQNEHEWYWIWVDPSHFMTDAHAPKNLGTICPNPWTGG
jgi:hypothetical protein